MSKITVDRAMLKQALEAFRKCVPMDGKHAEVDAVFKSLRDALFQEEQEEQRLVRVPDGLAQSDAQCWLDKRGAIIDACKVHGFTIVTTANGVHLMRLGRIEAKTAALEQEEREPAACFIGAKGSAFDLPTTKRAYTYAEQPGNVAASKLGRSIETAKRCSAGDGIDAGLVLLKALQSEGFGVFQLGAEYTTTPRREWQRDELLAALKMALPQLIGRAEQTARAAIAKAEEKK
jgi:hypothetical protein